MLRIVSFDLVGTLTDFHYENYIWKEAIPELYARKRGICLEDAKNYVLREYNHIGKTDIRWYLPEFWFRHFNLDGDPLDVFRLHTDKVRFYPEVPLILKKLSQEYALIIVSGTTRDVIEIIIKKFRRYFKQIFTPVSNHQETKKTPQFYEMICKILAVEPCVIAHVGDEWHSDVISPRKIGINSFHLDRTGAKSGRFVIKDLRELEEHLVNL